MESLFAEWKFQRIEERGLRHIERPHPPDAKIFIRRTHFHVTPASTGTFSTQQGGWPPQDDYTSQVDLVEMQAPKLIAQHKLTRYFLTVIGMLSKYAWAIALKSKEGEAFHYLLERKYFL